MSVRLFGNILINNPPGTPIPAAAIWASAFQLQSPWAGSFPFFPQPPASATDTPDCTFDIPNTQTIANAANYIIPPGCGYANVPATAGTTFALQLLTGAGAGTWTTQGAAAAATAIVYFYAADGANVRLNNAGASPGTVVFYSIR